ncbi:MAG: hypothetical protein HND47_11325 [Chloroflexi bacterium]|nr:hypothetical protein [Chloroflexota bacterium]
MDRDLESLYEAARSALKAKEYDRASGLLKQILLIDENYKDTSRLLAQSVKLKRRKWYNDPRLWGGVGFLIIVALGVFIAPRLRGLYVTQDIPPTSTSIPTITLTPTKTEIPTETPIPTLTPIPLAWKRVWLGQEFPRDSVSALAINPKDPEVLYAGMKYAGIYKSIDGGLSWSPAHHGLGNAHIGSLLVDPQNPNILYAGTMGGIFKSEDSGENWAEIGAEIDVSGVEAMASYWNLSQDHYSGIYLLMDPQDSSHLYARDHDNIYESMDQGESWKTVYSSQEGCPGKIYSWMIHPIDGKTLFIGAGMDCEAGIYTSTDGGQTWAPVRLLDRTQNYLIESAALSVGLDGQGNTYFYWGLHSRSNFSALFHIDSGVWRTILTFDPPAAFDSAGSVYFGCDTFLCKFDLDEKQRLRLGKPEVGVAAVIAISPHDPNTIFFAGEGIAVSKDGGQTWSKRSNGLGGMLVTLETGEETPPILYMLQEEKCEIIRISPWNPAESNEPGQSLYTSKDGGQTWELSTDVGCYLIKDAREPTLYRIGLVLQHDREGNSYRWLWRSQDSGKSWTKVFLPEGGATLTAQGRLLYLYLGIFLGDGTAPPYHWEYVSADYGREWRTLKPPKEPKLCYGSTLQFIDAYRPMTIDPSDGNHVFVIDNGILLESHDSCETTEPFAAAPNRSMNSIAFDPNNATTVYAGTDSGAYVSFDGGKTWNEINEGLLGATVVYSLVVDKDSNVYAATPYGIFKLEGK